MSYFPPLGQPSTEGWPQPGIRTRLHAVYPEHLRAERRQKCTCGGVAYFHGELGDGPCDDCGCQRFEMAP